MMDLEATFTMNSAQAEQAIKRVTFDTDKLAKTGKEAERSIRSLNTGFDQTSRGANNLRLSAEKAGIGFKSLITGVLDSKQPVMDLAQSMSYLGRAFKVGVAGTVAIVGISEVIKGLTKENTALDEITKSLTGTLETFSKSMSTLSFDAAIGQANALGDALDKAFEKMNEPGFAERLGQGVSDIFTGGAKTRASQAVVKTAGGIETAKAISERQLARRVEISLAARTSRLEAQRLSIIDEYNNKKREAIKLGQSDNFLSLLQTEYDLKILDINKQIGEEAEKAQRAKEEAQKKSFEESLRIARAEQAMMEENAQLQKRYAEEARKENERTIREKEKLEEESFKNAQKRASELIAQQDIEAAQRSQLQAELGGGILESSRPGRQALETARKQRKEQVRKEDFKTQDEFLRQEAERLSRQEGATLTKQDVRKRLAARQAAGEMPSLKERLVSGIDGTEPGQLARGISQSRMGEKGKGIPDLVVAVEDLIKKWTSAPLVTSGSGGN